VDIEGVEVAKESPAIRKRLECHPLKGCCQRHKLPHSEKIGFLALLIATDIVTIAVISFFSMSAFAAPVTHQDQGRCRRNGSSTARSALRGPENLRFQAVSNW